MGGGRWCDSTAGVNRWQKSEEKGGVLIGHYQEKQVPRLLASLGRGPVGTSSASWCARRAARPRAQSSRSTRWLPVAAPGVRRRGSRACDHAAPGWKTPAPTANADTVPTRTTPASSTAPSIPSPLPPPLAPAASRLAGAVRSWWCRSAGAASSTPLGSPPPQPPPPSALSYGRRFLLPYSSSLSSRRGSGRTRGKRRYAPSRATTLPVGRDGSHSWVQTRVPGHTRERPQLIQSDDGLHRSTPASSYRSSADPIFISMGGPQTHGHSG